MTPLEDFPVSNRRNRPKRYPSSLRSRPSLRQSRSPLPPLLFLISTARTFSGRPLLCTMMSGYTVVPWASSDWTDSGFNCSRFGSCPSRLYSQSTSQRGNSSPRYTAKRWEMDLSLASASRRNASSLSRRDSATRTCSATSRSGASSMSCLSHSAMFNRASNY